MRKRFRSTEPRVISSKFKTKCAETGEVIEKGETVIYYPISCQVYKTTTEQAKDYYEMKEDDSFVNRSF